MDVTTGTPQALTLGARLREIRESRKWSLRSFAHHLGVNHANVSRWEAGKRSPDPETVARILGALGVSATEAEEIGQLARATSAPQWLAVHSGDRQRQMDALLRFESVATRIIDVSPLMIPGLLQTSSYARALMAEGGVPQEEIETRVRVRWGRREVIERTKQPAEFLALIGETALRARIGGCEAMHEQLRHLASVAEWGHVTVQVIPSSAGWHPALEGPFFLLESNGRYSRIVHIENRRAGLFFHEPDDVNAYVEAVEKLEEIVMSPEDSAKLIARSIDELEKMQ